MASQTNRYSIREQSAGRYTARWYDDAGRRRSKTFGTRTEAKKFLDNIKSDRNRGDYIDPSDARRNFREVAELWFSSRNLRPKTRAAYRTILDQRLYPTFADRPVGSITTMDLTAWITDLSLHGKRINHNNKGPADPTKSRTTRDARYRQNKPDAGALRAPAVRGLQRNASSGAALAPGTVHNAVRVMNQVLDAAVRARYLRGNPANGLTRDDMPKHHRTEVGFLTAGEVERLAEAMHRVVVESKSAAVAGADASSRATALALLVRFMVQTGMRAGECVALRWENLDLMRGRVTVAESISTLTAAEWYIVPPKTNITRVVPLTGALVSALKDHAQVVGEAGGFAPEMYVWAAPSDVAPSQHNPTGSRFFQPMHWGKDFYLAFWKDAVKQAGLPKTLRAHDLRHTCAALLIAANVPAKAIQAHLGHSSYKVTMDTYGHLYEDSSDKVTDAMGTAFAAPASEPSNVRALRG